MELDAIVLAAGHSSRMGREKALLAIDGHPLVAQHVSRYRELCRRVVVVVRPELSLRVQASLGALARERVDILAVTTASPAESLCRGVQHLAVASAVLVTPVDLLPPRATTLRGLLAAFEDDAVLASTPTYRQRGGHPVLLRGSLLDAYRRVAPGDAPPLREVLGNAGAARRRVEVDDPRVAGDFDTPADLPMVENA